MPGRNETFTHDEERKSNAEYESVYAEDPNVVLALDDPRRKGDSHAQLLSAIRMAIQLVILSDRIISQTVIDQGQMRCR